MTDIRLSRSVPLDQLVLPDVDVREHRSEEAVMSLASSMGDPDVGQLQPVLVTPHADDLDPDAWDEDGLHQWFVDGKELQIIDGVTRYKAAQRLGWHDVWAWIVAEPPEDTTIAQLDANTERIQMTQYETARALKSHYDDTGATLEEIADKVGYSPSYLSQIFGAMDGPEWLVEAWRHPDHPLETSHALAIHAMLSPDSIEAYQEAGDLGADEARNHAVEDARLMVDVQGNHDLPVSEFRQRCKRCQTETLDQLRDGRDLDEKRADGQTASADRQHSEPTTPDVGDCTCCGADRPYNRRYALEVCEDCYGMLSDVESRDEVLMDNAAPPAEPAESSRQPADADPDPVEALSQAFGLSRDEAAAVVAEVEQQVDRVDQEARHA